MPHCDWRKHSWDGPESVCDPKQYTCIPDYTIKGKKQEGQRGNMIDTVLLQKAQKPLRKGSRSEL